MPKAPKTQLLDEAARLRSLGFGLCGILAGEKVPVYREWTRYSLEPDRFSGAYADANLGILGGALSGDVVVVDPDKPEIRAEAARRLPRTMTDGRPSAGPGHYYYRVTDVPPWATAGPQVAGGIGGPRIFHFADGMGHPIGLDFLGTGAQAVCPPSLHPSGERRRWIVGPEHILTIPYLDLWAIVKELAKDFGAANTDRECERHAAAEAGELATLDSNTRKRVLAYLARCVAAVSGEGGHSRTMWAARCMVWGFGLGAGVGFDLLQQYYNPRCEPPWSDAELWHKCEDAYCKPFEKPWGWLCDEVAVGDGLATTCLSDIRPEPVRWLVEGLIPLGKVSLVAGDGGHGKTMLTLALTAAVTNGLPAFGLEYMPQPAGEVLIISCEDDYADTVVPRLLALGADLGKVHRVDGITTTGGKPQGFSLAHYENLERELEKRPDVRLVVIDPAGAYIGKAGCDDHKDSDLRSLLGPLAELAARRRVTVLLVKHLNKGVTARAVNKVSGSTGYVNSVRSAFLVAPDPADGGRKLFLPMKFNCGSVPQGFAYKLTALPPDDAATVLHPFTHLEASDRERLQAQLFKPEWLGPVDDDPDTVLGDAVKKEHGPSKPEQAAVWLTEYLTGYRWPSEEVIRAGGEIGYTRKTLFAAKGPAGVGAAKETGRKHGPWFWGIGDPATVRGLPLRPTPSGADGTLGTLGTVAPGGGVPAAGQYGCGTLGTPRTLGTLGTLDTLGTVEEAQGFQESQESQESQGCQESPVPKAPARSLAARIAANRQQNGQPL